MRQWFLKVCVFFFIFLHISNGCTIDSVEHWLEPQNFHFKDTHEGLIISQNTANIEGINLVNFADGLNRGPYLDIALKDSVLTVTTTEAYKEYEKYETQLSIRFTVTFSCTGGSTRPLTYVFNIIDTNNHSPVFEPDTYTFPLALPVPPGFKVSGCDYLIVRDIDLTTSRIDFNIEDNPNFEIVYYGQIQPKEFGAFIRTKTLIRSLPESLSFTINATDVDLTGDEPRTGTAVVNIVADNAFRLPDSLVFSATFYEADYTRDDGLILRDYISLREGYDDQVKFSLEGEYAHYFDLVNNDNRLSLEVTTSLPEDTSESQLLLIVVAEREYTSGTSATVLVHLPKETELQFELPLYEGQIKDNALEVPSLTIQQGHEEIFEINLVNEFASYFSANRQGNIITLSMNPLPIAVIQDNSVLSIQVVASTSRNITASTVVVLEIIKDDYVSPVFEKTTYVGSYDPETGLAIEPIILLQGFDDTVIIRLKGDHANYFEIVEQSKEINLTASIPSEIWAEGNILITVEAVKPRTVGANAAVLINLPTARKLSFEAASYSGSLENNEVSLETIVLNVGYATDVRFELSGEFSSYFTVNNTENQVTISLENDLPENIIVDNNAVMLSLIASGLNALPATTNILLDIIKDDHVTPVFEKAIYNGVYDATSGLSLAQIVIVQGYDDTIDVTLDGGQAQLFTPKREGRIITLSGTVPAEIWPERNLILTLRATKPRTVGANAAIQIRLPEARELSFEKSTYTGSFENNTVNIEDIILSVGYNPDVVFKIIGEYADHFILSNVGNKLWISLNTSPSENFLLENDFIVLTISASGLNAITTFTTILLKIIKDDISTPVFSQHIYEGTYTNASYYNIEEISLSQGYDNTVSFRLDGDHAQYFEMEVTENNVAILLKSAIPEEVIFSEKVLLFKVSAEKDLTVGATAIVSIQFPNELTEPTIMRFSQSTYLASLNDDKLEINENIILETGFTPDTQFNLYGEYKEYFVLSSLSNVITISIQNSLPAEDLKDIGFIILQIEAQRERAVTVFAALVIDIVKSDAVVFPIFEKSFYSGTYSKKDGLQFEEEMRLAVGFDETVKFSLEGDDSQWFTLTHTSSDNVTLSLYGEGLPQDTADHLLFSIVAAKPNNISGRSAIFISITDFFTDRSLRFLHDHYKGSIEGDVLSLEVITLENDYSEETVFLLIGDYVDYFQIIYEEGNITIELISELPPELKEEYNILIFQLEARLNIFRAHATIIIEINPTAINTIPVLVLENTYYTGSYSDKGGMKFDSQITALNKLNGSIQFGLEGDHSLWFDLEPRSENSVALVLTTKIPPEVLENNRKLVFVVKAARPESVTARATIIISLTDEYTTSTFLRFEQINYSGSIDDDNLSLEPIVLREGFTSQVLFTLEGALAPYFKLDLNGPVVTIKLQNAIPEDSLPNNHIILLELQASAVQAVPAVVTIVLAVNQTEDIPIIEQLSFAETYYTGLFNEENGFTFDKLISLTYGYDDIVKFGLEGDNSIWFGLERKSENSLALTITTPIPPAVLGKNRKLIFVVTAAKPGTMSARATIVISLTDEYSTSTFLEFEQNSYTGSIDDDNLNLEPIVLSKGFTSEVSFKLQGVMAPYFNLDPNGPIVTIKLQNAIPEDSLPNNYIILLELQASAVQAVPAFATIVMAVNRTEDTPIVEQLSFAETYYTGIFNEENGFTFDKLISLTHGYDDRVEFTLEGDNSIWFGLEQKSENSLGLTITIPIPPAVLGKNRKLIFVVIAAKPGSMSARATIVISLTDEYSTSTFLEFEQHSYTGFIDDDNLYLDPIVLRKGFTTQVSFTLQGDMAPHFNLDPNGPIVTIKLQNAIPEDSLPNNHIILLELQASAVQAVPAVATIVLAVNRPEDTPIIEQLSFAETYYTGLFSEENGFTFDKLISLSHGYDDGVEFTLEGDNSIWFGLEKKSGNSFALIITTTIPLEILVNNQKLIFVITAAKNKSVTTRATIVISLLHDSSTDPTVYFDKILYNGIIQLGNVMHESIKISGFNGTNIKISGQNADLFESNLSDEEIRITLRSSAILPIVSHIALELHADSARAVLVLNIEESETPVLPTVTFGSSSYVLSVTLTHTGSVGKVQATSDNGEQVTYSLLIDDVHLRERLSVSNDGELRLSAPANSGAYSFQVEATTVITRASGTASVHLKVEAVTVCGDDIFLPPLIILERDEEEPHRNLVVLNQTAFEGCQYTLSNIWPEGQAWLYVDDEGLHTRSIDREHESIAFMALSQIQVELILECEGDVTGRTKRSLSSKSTNWLGPYEYGSNKWILTNSIWVNTRRSLVNLIVNDINDNVPIFIGKENEPIVVGYPVPELEDIILPRALAELKATDADIGENAALVYWSTEDSLAVSPSTGFVHIRNSSNLQNNARLTVSATDQNGAGLTGSLELMVTLLQTNNIAVLNIRNAFLEDEEQILSNLTKAAGYEVKALRSEVVSESDISQSNRAASNELTASLQLFVYGLNEREPVDIQKLITDVNTNTAAVNIARIISLKDHLEENEICVLPGRDTGLLAATIALSVLLFILLVAGAVWFFLKWRKNKDYDQFSNRNSLATRNDSLEEPKPEILAKPRLNIEELKRSERKLQERLDIPVTNASAETSVTNEKPLDAIINISTPDSQMPIIIQTIDKLKDITEESEDDDEFGEKMKSRRKSVVTFNENVEKIIHVEDSPDNAVEDYEVFKL